MTGPSELSMRFAADFRALPSVRSAMRRWLESLGIGGPAADDIVLASWEACVNAVEHPLEAGEPLGTAERDVCIDARADDAHVCVLVRDAGNWRDQVDRPYRGLGLRLVTAVMDDVAISREEGGTIVRMCRCVDRGPRRASTSRSTTRLGADRVGSRFRGCRDPESASADPGSAETT